MWVGMEEAVLENHLENGVGCPPGELHAVHTRGLQSSQVAELQSANPLECDDAAGALSAEDARNVDRLIASERSCESLRVVRLRHVVELSAQRVRSEERR